MDKRIRVNEIVQEVSAEIKEGENKTLRKIRNELDALGFSSFADAYAFLLQGKIESLQTTPVDVSVPEGRFKQMLHNARHKWWHDGPIGPHVQRLIRTIDESAWSPQEDDRVTLKDKAISLLGDYADSVETLAEIATHSQSTANFLDMLFHYCYENPPKPKPKLVKEST